jgi:hypothetical protein
MNLPTRNPEAPFFLVRCLPVRYPVSRYVGHVNEDA